MSINPDPTVNNAQPAEKSVSDKEINFRKFEEKYERDLQAERDRAEQERQRRIELEALLSRSAAVDEDDDENSEPYIDKKRLKKELTNFEKKTQTQTNTTIQKAVQEALEKERQESWIEQNPDFYDTMKDAQKLADKAPATAKTILKMPEGFERQKLVYYALKELGLNKSEEKPKSSIQDEIKNNKKSLYYNPSGMASAPYQSQGDFSPTGQKSAYDKMQALKASLRLG